MKDEFDEVQKLWLSIHQTQSEEDANKQLLASIREIENKWMRSNIWSTFWLTLTILFFGWILIFSPMQTIWGNGGLVLITIDMIVYILFLWQKRIHQFTTRKGKSIAGFIKFELNHLNRRKLILKIILPIYSFLLILGINLVYIDALKRGSLLFRLSLHIGVTVFIAVVVILMKRKEWRKFVSDTVPVYRQLNEVLRLLVDKR
jgi:hypothetical protein